MIATTTKPVLRLTGADGNGCALIGKAQRTAIKAGWSQAQIKALVDRLTAAQDYDELLSVLFELFEVE